MQHHTAAPHVPRTARHHHNAAPPPPPSIGLITAVPPPPPPSSAVSISPHGYAAVSPVNAPQLTNGGMAPPQAATVASVANLTPPTQVHHPNANNGSNNNNSNINNNNNNNSNNRLQQQQQQNQQHHSHQQQHLHHQHQQQQQQHHHHHNATAQMQQKLRQQHQHLNNTNNSGNLHNQNTNNINNNNNNSSTNGLCAGGGGILHTNGGNSNTSNNNNNAINGAQYQNQNLAKNYQQQYNATATSTPPTAAAASSAPAAIMQAHMANMPPPQSHRNYHHHQQQPPQPPQQQQQQQQQHHLQHMPMPPSTHHKSQNNSNNNNNNNNISMQQHHSANIVIATTSAAAATTTAAAAAANNNHHNSGSNANLIKPTIHPSMVQLHHQQQQHNNHHHHHQQQQQQHQHQLQQLPQNYYVHNNQYKPKYNNYNQNNHNNNNNHNINNGNGGSGNMYMPPKSILQNQNRHMKARAPVIQPSTSTGMAKQQPQQPPPPLVLKSANTLEPHQQNGNNITITPERTPVVSAHQSAAGDEMPNATENDVPKATANAENEATTDAAAHDGSSNDVAHVNTILPNVDSSVSKHAKEKTPMCLVNELARYNKITHQYRLTSEKGPAHCKRFTVTLKLGEEEYSAEGFKIKKAQHLAAADAIEKTKYKHPVPKLNRRGDDSGGSGRVNITPTVELNALAMKLGQQTYYLFDPRQVSTDAQKSGASETVLPPAPPVPFPPPPPALPAGGPPPPPPRMLGDPSATPVYMRRPGALPPGAYMAPPAVPQPLGPRFAPRGFAPKFGQHQRFAMMPPMPPPHNHPMHPHHHIHAPHMPYLAPLSTPYRITLIVGKQKFIGVGRTLQQAKHDAASRALQVLKVQTAIPENDEHNQSLDDEDAKSPISTVHELGIKRGMTVTFKVLREEGPAHMKNFITACIVGNMITEGEGNGKKISKKRAADKMLEELKKLPPPSPTKTPTKRLKTKTPSKSSGQAATATGGTGATAAATTTTTGGSSRYDRRRINAAHKDKPEGGGGPVIDLDLDNPITKLIQMQQTRKQKEPIFDLIAKNGNESSRRREFIIEVSAQGMVARGTGNSKKVAKRNAAQNLLNALQEAEQAKSAAATTDGEPAALERTAADSSASEPSNKNAESELIVGHMPGILIIRQNRKHSAKKKDLIANTVGVTSTAKSPVNSQEQGNKVTEATPPIATTTSKNDESATIPKADDTDQTVTTTITEATVSTAETTPSNVAIDAAAIATTRSVAANADAAATNIAADATTTTTSVVGDSDATIAISNVAADVSATPTTNVAIDKTATISNVANAVAATPTTATTTSAVPSETTASETTTTKTNATGDATDTTTTVKKAEGAASTTTTTTATPTPTVSKSSNSSSSSAATGVPMKDQLLYLSKLLGFEVNFSDYPKGNHNEFLTIVTLSTNPPQICHGVGVSSDESQNDAAKNALKILSELGLNNATTK